MGIGTAIFSIFIITLALRLWPITLGLIVLTIPMVIIAGLGLIGVVIYDNHQKPFEYPQPAQYQSSPYEPTPIEQLSPVEEPIHKKVIKKTKIVAQIKKHNCKFYSPFGDGHECLTYFDDREEKL